MYVNYSEDRKILKEEQLINPSCAILIKKQQISLKSLKPIYSAGLFDMLEISEDPIMNRHLRYVLIGSLIGYFCQIMAGMYLKKVEKKEVNEDREIKPKTPIIKTIGFRGGVIPIPGAAILVGVAEIIQSVGIITGASIGSVTLFQSIFNNKPLIRKYLAWTTPSQIASSYALKVTKAVATSVLIATSACGDKFNYMEDILKIPGVESGAVALKKKAIDKYLSDEENLKNRNKKILFVICTAQLLFWAAQNDRISLYIFLEELIQAVKEGKISKKLGRLILRKLRRLARKNQVPIIIPEDLIPS